MEQIIAQRHYIINTATNGSSSINSLTPSSYTTKNQLAFTSRFHRTDMRLSTVDLILTKNLFDLAVGIQEECK